MRFEWDPNKNEINKQKHKISFEDAQTVFYDEHAILFDDRIIPIQKADLSFSVSRKEKTCAL